MKSSVLMLVLAIANSCDNAPQNATAVEEAEIRSIRAATNAAIEKHDTASLARAWSSDYLLLSSRNVEAKGRKASLESLAAQFNLRPDVVYVRTPGEVHVFLQWSMASETGQWIGHWTEGGARIEVSGDYYSKWHKIDGKWMLRAEIFTALKCSGGEYCEKGPI